MVEQLEQTMMVERNDSLTFQDTIDLLKENNMLDHAENINAHFNA